MYGPLGLNIFFNSWSWKGNCPYHRLATSMNGQITYFVTEQRRQNERQQAVHWHRQSPQKTFSHQEHKS